MCVCIANSRGRTAETNIPCKSVILQQQQEEEQACTVLLPCLKRAAGQ